MSARHNEGAFSLNQPLPSAHVTVRPRAGSGFEHGQLGLGQHS